MIREDIPDLYFMNNLKYEQTFIRIARDVLMKAAGNYMAQEYWTNRRNIRTDMHDLLDIELKKAHARCTGVQIMNIILPKSFENSIVETQVEV